MRGRRAPPIAAAARARACCSARTVSPEPVEEAAKAYRAREARPEEEQRAQRPRPGEQENEASGRVKRFALAGSWRSQRARRARSARARRARAVASIPRPARFARQAYVDRPRAVAATGALPQLAPHISPHDDPGAPRETRRSAAAISRRELSPRRRRRADGSRSRRRFRMTFTAADARGAARRSPRSCRARSVRAAISGT